MAFISQVPVTEEFVAGDRYLVTWDGTEYECKAENYDDTIIGNKSLLGISEAGTEPFAMTTFAFYGKTGDATITLQILTDSTESTHTVAIQHIVVEKKLLDLELMPHVFLPTGDKIDFVSAFNLRHNPICVPITLYADSWEINTETVVGPAETEEMSLLEYNWLNELAKIPAYADLVAGIENGEQYICELFCNDSIHGSEFFYFHRLIGLVTKNVSSGILYVWGGESYQPSVDIPVILRLTRVSTYDIYASEPVFPGTTDTEEEISR